MSSTCSISGASPCSTFRVTDSTSAVPTVETSASTSVPVTSTTSTSTTSTSTTSTSTTSTTSTTTCNDFGSFMSLLMGEAVFTDFFGNTCAFGSKSPLETSFHRVRTVDINSSESLSLIKAYEAEIVRHKLLVKQDKIDYATAVEALLAEVVKFNAEHPNDQLDVSLDVSVMYKQYLFLREKFASQTIVDSTSVNSTSVVSTPVDSIPVVSTSVDSVPVVSIPVDSTPVDSTPVDSTPVVLSPVATTCSTC